MWKNRKREIVVSLLVAFCAAPCLALLPDPQLLAMVPPNAWVVAGLCSPNRVENNDSLLLVNLETKIDLGDFLTVFGEDEAKHWRQLVLVAAAPYRGKRAAHSVLASGQFNTGLIY